MAQRVLAARLVALILLVLWTGLAVAILVAYRPGGPADALVGLAAFLPCPLAAAALVWPPVARDGRANLAMLWTGVVSVLLLAPLTVGVAQTLGAGGRQTLLPSLEVVYAAFLALGTTAAYAALGIAQRVVPDPAAARRRVTATTILGITATLIGMAVFGGVAIANEQGLRARSPASSAWGPTDPTRVPPPCDQPPTLGPGALVTIDGTATIDRQPVGTAAIRGVRDGTDEHWEGTLDGRSGRSSLEYARVEAMASWVADDGPAEPRGPGLATLLGDDGLTLDGPVVAAIEGPDSRQLIQTLALTVFDGAQARHCRRQIDGTTALRTVVALAWLVDRDLDADPARLGAWRGELDWWVFTDGQVGRAEVIVSGYPGDAWPESSGISATLQATLTATLRDVAHDVPALGPAAP